MTLIDLLSTCDDNMNVNVYGLDGSLLSRYDGRDSIDDNLNGFPVVWFYPVADGVLGIGINF